MKFGVNLGFLKNLKQYSTIAITLFRSKDEIVDVVEEVYESIREGIDQAKLVLVPVLERLAKLFELYAKYVGVKITRNTTADEDFCNEKAKALREWADKIKTSAKMAELDKFVDIN